MVQNSKMTILYGLCAYGGYCRVFESLFGQLDRLGRYLGIRDRAEVTSQRDHQTLLIRIGIESQPDENDRRLINEGLDTFNAAKAGSDNAQDLWAMARRNNGHLLGGLKGRTFYKWLFDEWLWVSADVRGYGVGAELLATAEDAARERQCIGAYVDTFSFQAPDFYRRNGYEEFGRIAELPPGHACIWLMKTFKDTPA